MSMGEPPVTYYQEPTPTTGGGNYAEDERARASTAYAISVKAIGVKAMPVMPPAIAKAVVGVMKEVKKLAKEGENTFQRYRYTSVDQFYEALGPLMAEHGLFTVAFEKSTAVEMREAANDRGDVKKSTWLLAEFDFWLYHEGGEAFGPVGRHIQVPATGAQSYASAQSYAEKYFLRTLFKVPTGDVDEVENLPQRGVPETAPAPARGKQTVTSGKKEDERRTLTPTLTPDESKAVLAQLLASLGASETRAAIAKWAQDNAESKDKLLAADRETLVAAFTKRQSDVKAAAKAPPPAEETAAPATEEKVS